MLEIPEPSPAPESWAEFRARAQKHWARPFLYVDWMFAKIAWFLSRWSLLRVLAYAETFSVLIAVIFWVAEAKERRQQKHYQAWQVINTAQGKGGSGGRTEALEQLNDDHVPLVGVDVAEAFLQDVNLEKAELRRTTFRACDLRNAHFRRAGLQDTIFASANLRSADLRDADLSNASMTDADLTGADLRRANVRGVSFEKADLRGADLAGLVGWRETAQFQLADIQGVKNAPDGFVEWAEAHGAVSIVSTEEWNATIESAGAKK